jgi:hypothetical protein
MEFCMTATEDPERALLFATANDLVAHQRGEETTLFSQGPDVRASFLGLTVYRHDAGSFAIECGFEAQAVGETSEEEIADLAQRFGLEWRNSEETYVMTRHTPHLIVLAYLSVTNEWPCPGDGAVEVAPELLDSYLQVCGRPGLRLQLQSAYSPTEIPQH